jgi:5-methylcytosine-specific restriction endonuclease McrA
MTSSEAKRLWRRSIKLHFGCTCVYCGETYELHELTLDHVHPRSLGGENVNTNVVPACTRCNQDKGSNHWQSWMRAKFGVNKLREHLIMEYIN